MLLTRLLVKTGDLAGAAAFYLPLAVTRRDNAYCTGIAGALRQAQAEARR